RASALHGPGVLGDEVLPPDSSRFWPTDGYTPGRVQPSFDKQFVRDWLTSPDSWWDLESVPPPLTDHVVQRTRQRYLEAAERLIGSPGGVPPRPLRAVVQALEPLIPCNACPESTRCCGSRSRLEP